ncbi:Peptidase_C25 domain-containing protein [Hyphomicrobiales bacterium]|nr:Peptidase_C25 domain-containing protein [Hyphomicrobiales bacterium]CAH1701555.1 Peptidase_C25 domain-containing protein [Hyphomicrobiales bacterium]CAI0345730.1 Peptidase_C25 domain-containing protein [Hyphomicrobiales bacterium]
MPTVDKVVISNLSALQKKYGAPGATAIKAALTRLIAADLARGLQTQVVEIDDLVQMAPFGATAVISEKDERGAKTAVDAICKTLLPDYVMLLDGPDVIPHIELNRITGITDSDASIPSDLPYASAAPFSRTVNAYLAVTRVVGRLPVPPGTSDEEVLIRLLDISIAHESRSAENHAPFFAISCDVWRVSTQLSLSNLFGTHAGMHIAPNAAHTRIDPNLTRLTHFINCHGANNDWRFYGQGGVQYPVAMESNRVAGHLAPGVIVAAECCYGAQLYNHALAGWPQPICMTYLLGGAAAFVGSTNIAYGPPAANGEADLICQYFLEEALKGASTGRAMLQARQRFVAGQVMSVATNLKTIAQFVLYGDPSLVPTVEPVAASPAGADPALAVASVSSAKDLQSARKTRRVFLESDGMAFAAAATFPGRPVELSADVEKRLQSAAQMNGFSTTPKAYAVTGGAKFKAASKRIGRSQTIAIAVERAKQPAKTTTEVELPSYRVFVAHIMDDGVTRIDISESR